MFKFLNYFYVKVLKILPNLIDIFFKIYYNNQDFILLGDYNENYKEKY